MPRELPVISAYFPLSDMGDLLFDYLVVSQIVPTLRLRVMLSLLTLDHCNSHSRFAAV